MIAHGSHAGILLAIVRGTGGDSFSPYPDDLGCGPLYFTWLLNEITIGKANFKTAVQTGFSFIWASVQWAYPYVAGRPSGGLKLDPGMLLAVNVIITLAVFVLGVTAFISGLRRRFPRYGKFLGHTRFANYFMISIYPMQAHYLAWSWDRLAAVALFAIPVWAICQLVFAPMRK